MQKCRNLCHAFLGNLPTKKYSPQFSIFFIFPQLFQEAFASTCQWSGRPWSCCTDGVQLTLQNLGGHLEMLCRRLATCILQQCRRRRGRILLQWLDGALHDGWLRSTNAAKSLRLVRSSPFSVATCTFQVDAENSGGSGRSVMREQRRRRRRRRQPLQQVASSVCSLSVFPTSVTQPRSTWLQPACRRRCQTRGGGKPRTRSSYIYVCF